MISYEVLFYICLGLFVYCVAGAGVKSITQGNMYTVILWPLVILNAGVHSISGEDLYD